MKKYLAVAVISLFIGLAVAPSINANVSKEALVEFTTEVCGLNGGKQTVKLTQEEAQEVEDLFDSIRERLNATESREEAEEIFKEAVVELDKYGLLGGLSVKQAQRLVTGDLYICKMIELFYSKYYNQINEEDNSNNFCLIIGDILGEDQVVNFYFSLWLRTLYTLLLNIMIIVREKNPNASFGLNALLLIYLFLYLQRDVQFGGIFVKNLIPKLPFMLGGSIYYGAWIEEFNEFNHAEGWVHTIGTNGHKNWSDEIFGNYFSLLNPPYYYFWDGLCFVGTTGFFGLLYGYRNKYGYEYPTKYLGYAIGVKLSDKPPITT